MPADAKRAGAALARTFLRLHPAEAAKQLDGCAPEEIARLVDTEPTASAVPLVERLAPDVAAQVVGRLGPDSARRILSAMEPVRTVSMLEWLEPDVKSERLALIDPGLAADLRAMTEYPGGTAGRLMDPRAQGFRRGSTVGDVLARLRRVRQRQISDVFIVDDDRRLLGSVPLQELAVSGPGEALESLARPPVSVEATAPHEEVVERLTERRLSSLPVVDFDGRLLGVIRHATLVTAAQEDVAADIQTMVGASRQERALSRVSFAVSKRLPWLEINLATAFLAAAVVGLFEGTIARFTALAVLLPVVAGQSGNTGAQALAVTMRGLALREIRVRHWLQVARKEVAVALINGVVVALTTAAGVYVWSGSTGLTIVIGISMVLSMIAAGLAGVVVPMALTATGQDPAQSSSIVLTTVTDVVGFASFLGIATLLAGML